MTLSAIAKGLGRIHLAYLTLLPGVASLFLLPLLRPSDFWIWMIFLFGTGIVGMYLSFIVSEVPVSGRVFPNLLLLLDAPILIFLHFLFGISFPQLLLELVLIELAAMLLPFFYFALAHPMSSLQKRFLGLVFTGSLLLGTVYLLFLINAAFGPVDIIHGATILGIILVSAVMHHKTQPVDQVKRDGTVIIGMGTMFWILSLFLGAAFG